MDQVLWTGSPGKLSRRQSPMPSGEHGTLHATHNKIREKAKAGCRFQLRSQKKSGWPGHQLRTVEGEVM